MERILFLIPTLHAGGAEKQLLYLSKGLAERGYNITVGALKEGGELWRLFKKESAIDLVSFSKKGKIDLPRFFIEMRRLCKEKKIDILQSFLPAANCLGCMAGKFFRITPSLMAIRCSDMDYKCFSLSSYLFSKVEKIASYFSEKVIYNSVAGCNYHEALGYCQPNSSVIHNGIDIEKIDVQRQHGNCSAMRKKENIGDRDVLVSIIGRIHPMKNHICLLKAVKMLVERKYKNIKVLIVGEEGGSPTAQTLHNYVQAHSLKDSVRFLGFRDDVIDIITSSNIIVSCSSFGEGTSNAILEAMACEKPVIATDVGDAKRILADQRGLVMESKEPHELAEKIEFLINNPDTAERMGKKAREHVVAHFTVEKMIDGYQILYRNITESKRGK